MALNQELGKWLRNVRKNRGLTQAMVAKELHRTSACISKYEAGEIAMDVETFCSYCHLLRISPSILLAEVSNVEIEPQSGLERRYEPFFNCSPMYLYWIDNVSKKINTGVLELSLKTGDARLYIFFNSCKNYKSAKGVYHGKLECFTSFSRIELQRVADPADVVTIMIYNGGAGQSYRVGQFYILTIYFQPSATKCILAQQPMEVMSESFLSQLRVSNEEIKYLKSSNSFLVFNSVSAQP